MTVKISAILKNHRLSIINVWD